MEASQIVWFDGSETIQSENEETSKQSRMLIIKGFLYHAKVPV